VRTHRNRRTRSPRCSSLLGLLYWFLGPSSLRPSSSDGESDRLQDCVGLSSAIFSMPPPASEDPPRRRWFVGVSGAPAVAPAGAGVLPPAQSTTGGGALRPSVDGVLCSSRAHDSSESLVRLALLPMLLDLLPAPRLPAWSAVRSCRLGPVVAARLLSGTVAQRGPDAAARGSRSHRIGGSDIDRVRPPQASTTTCVGVRKHPARARVRQTVEKRGPRVTSTSVAASIGERECTAPAFFDATRR